MIAEKPVDAAPKKGVAINKEARKAFDKAEKQLAELQQKQKVLEASLADSVIYEKNRKAELDKLLAEKADVDARLPVLEEEWLRLSEALEGSH